MQNVEGGSTPVLLGLRHPLLSGSPHNWPPRCHLTVSRIRICWCPQLWPLGYQVALDLWTKSIEKYTFNLYRMYCTTFAPVTIAPMVNANITPTLALALTLILILILILPWTKDPIITLTLTLCCWRYHHRSNCRRKQCRITSLSCGHTHYKLVICRRYVYQCLGQHSSTLITFKSKLKTHFMQTSFKWDYHHVFFFLFSSLCVIVLKLICIVIYFKWFY